MSIRATSKRWIEAGKVLAADPKQKVHCPRCEQGTLLVRDVVFESDNTMLERYLTCSACGASNVMRMRVPLAGS